MSQSVLIDRPPRIQPELPVETIEIPSPPQPAQSAIAQLIQMGLPLLTMVAFMFASMGAGSQRSPAMLLPMVLMVLSSGGIAVYSYLKEKRDYAAACAAYNERLVELTRDMYNYHDQQRRFYVYNYPDKDATARIVRDARWEVEKNDHDLRGNARLWERRTTDEDFGVIRLGMGTLPSTVLYVLKDSELHDDPLTRAAQKLQEDARFVDDIPVIISLRPPKGESGASDKGKVQEDEEKAEAEHARRTPAVHALGIAGERASVYEFVRAALAQTAVFHAAADQQMYVLAGHAQEWAWVERLPHCRGDENNPHMCFMDAEPDQKPKKGGFGETEEQPLPRFLEGIRKVLAQRKLQLQETNDEGSARGDPTLPHLLVVIDLLDAAQFSHDRLFSNLEGDAAVSILLAEGALLGAAVIFLVPDRGKVPGGCEGVIEIERTTPATNSKLMEFQRLHFRYAETGVNTYRYIGQADAVRQADELCDLAARMASLEMRQSFGGSLPAAVAFMSFNDKRTLEELTQAARANWTASRTAQNADWLRAKIGVMGGNKPRTLQFSAKKDGVHGMVAGSTGSGKSELLISLITQMAITYDPTVINFVLVDYKGGGAFKAFEELPHCVDIITNLAGEGVTRMFTAINAELQRRQKLNTDTNTKNIVDYRQQGLHLPLTPEQAATYAGPPHAPYPFLFIIIDEFAEMIQDRAEYRVQLETITRVGRAQGVSLILAAQRPTGVTDQMRSNIKFRICLRVESPGESREMLRRGDAAFLPGGIPGRGYLQVGNEDVDLIQVAYAGDKYVDPNREPLPDVFWPGRSDKYDSTADREPPELYRAIIAELAKLARAEAVPEQSAPWPGFLPEKLALTTPLVSLDEKVKAVTADRYLDARAWDILLMGQPREPVESLNSAVIKWLNDGEGWVERRAGSEGLNWERHALRPVVGLVDNPYAARQLPLVVDFPRGHAVIFGASGYGKTTFVRSLAVSLAATHSPDHAHIYLLDLGGRNLAPLADLPHVGAVINPDEEGYKERVEQLIRELDDIVDKRKTILSNAGVGDIYQYNLLHPAAALPGIVVAIDNFTEFKETFGGEKDDVETVLDRFTTLARESKPYGVHFLLTVSQLNVLSTQLYNIFTERFTLKLGDAGDYRAILGASVPDLAALPGRGYVSIDRVPLSFQIATPLEPRREGSQAALGENDDLAHLAASMKRFMEQAGHTYLKPVIVGALPKAVLLKQILARQEGLVLDETFLPRLKEVTRRRWADSRKAETADWLRVTFGLVSGNRPREMRLEAKADGVHGLIAGGTGSGKSELLMTLIVGLALNYDPSILNFVLVDFKGGGAFEPFKDLPHVVDIVTNLNRSGVQRMFTAIGAEIERRQALTKEMDVKDIVDYRRNGHHLTHEPMPHLFVIIDEYAEMISESPEYKAELERIARVGRSAGINLLLAAQRPVGVTDQMRANIKYRICLRVEETDTSREMLRRSDAAFLPNGMPGRGYLQVGNDNIELMQTAYTGETYAYVAAKEGERAPRFYDVIVDLAGELLNESGAKRPATPWPRPLPRALTLAAPLDAQYYDEDYVNTVTLGQDVPLRLNPFLARWLDDGGDGQSGAPQGDWPGVNWDTQALRAVVGLMDDPYNARQLPLVIDFNKGHAVIFGASGWGKTTLLRSVLVSLAATHSPDEFWAHVLDLGGRNLALLGEPPPYGLPHVGTLILPDEPGYQERVQQLLRELNETVDRRKQLFARAGVNTLKEYNGLGDRPSEPAILVVIDNFGEYIETFGGDDTANDQNNLMDALVALIRQAKAFGVHFIITANRLNVLSGKLYSLFTERFTLRIAEADDYASIVGARIGEIEEIPGRGYTRFERQALAFQVALPLGTEKQPTHARAETEQIRRVSAAMHARIAAAKLAQREYRAPLRVGALPKSSSFREVMAKDFDLKGDGPFLGQLKDAIAARWAWNRQPEHSDWLKVTLGIASGMKARTLALEAKRDGVHGMLAGGTGSGKSEALMTLIVGLALNYPPDLLNFVLVDYKGGGAFKPFEGLPHVVDIVTNLNKAAVNRMFTAINAEIMRRQAMNADTGTKDIVNYREKGLHLTREPYPHLFIIIDEYAEMIDDHEEYKAELESITRVGRSQGVNLILASQRPKGVTDQMRANIKLKLCLRVEQTDTSSEMLRRPDAAFLPNGIPGRGYLQVGNEPLELVQVSYTGEKQPDDRPAPVLWPERATRPAAATDDPPRFFDAVSMLSRELTGGQMARKPWPAFLPAQLSLQADLYDPKADRRYCLNPAVTDWLNGDFATEINSATEITEGAEGVTSAESSLRPLCPLWQGVVWSDEADPASVRRQAFRPVVGIVDDPLEARQFPLRFDLTREHLAVFGDSGWGKTSLLRAMIVDLAATHSPDEFRAYVLDLGGRNYRMLEKLPHLGAVIYGDEETFEERLQRLMDRLAAIADERSQLLAAAGENTVYRYNERFPDQALPAVLVVIDNFAPLHENYETFVEAAVTPLVRRCLAFGITFVIAANTQTNLPSRLLALFGEQITFKQGNPDRYTDIVGRGAIEIDDIPGRGYIRVGRRPLLFQAALPVGALNAGALGATRDPLPEAAELARLAANMDAAAAGRPWRHPVARISVLPEIVPLMAMLTAAPAPRRGRIEAVLGQSVNLLPAVFDLKRAGLHLQVVGPPVSGKTTVLYNLVFSLAHRYTPDEVWLVLVDPQRRFVEYGGRHVLTELPHVVAVAHEVKELAGLLPMLREQAEQLAAKTAGREVFVIVDNYDDIAEDLEQQDALARELGYLARRYGRDGLHFVLAGTMEGGLTEFKRAVQATNYGIGLRNADSLQTLRVMRFPASLRSGKDLAVGRGYAVKSGLPTMLQVASPYDGLPLNGAASAPAGAPAGAPASAAPDDETADRNSPALDDWVARLIERHGAEKPAWYDVALAEKPKAETAATAPAATGLTPKMLPLLQRAMLWDAQRRAEDAEAEPFMAPLLGQYSPAKWNDEGTLREVLRAVYYEVTKIPKELYEEMAGGPIDDDSMIVSLNAELPELSAEAAPAEEAATADTPQEAPQ